MNKMFFEKVMCSAKTCQTCNFANNHNDNIQKIPGKYPGQRKLVPKDPMDLEMLP